jgi:hypothetical protein
VGGPPANHIPCPTTKRGLVRAVLLLGPDDSVTSWQYDALEHAIGRGLEVVRVVHCLDENKPALRFRHAAYYLVALTTRRRIRALRPRSVASLVPPGTPHHSFRSVREGMWQRIPDEVTAHFVEADVVVKFGMNLLQCPDSLPVRHGVLSYHHGEPETYRGRPAGFYELRDGAPVQGVIVQVLSDQLDGGMVAARGYAPVVQHSYAQTMARAYAVGVPLLAQAVESLRRSEARAPEVLGPNFRLPTNLVVVRLAMSLLVRRLRRVAYGAFREKAWRVARVSTHLDLESSNDLSRHDLAPFAVPPGYAFLADPFWTTDGVGFYCEALNRTTGKGEIKLWREVTWASVDIGTGTGHASYPHVVAHEGEQYLLPEVSNHASPRLVLLDECGVTAKAVVPLQGLEDVRVVDASLIFHGGRWFLFGSPKSSAAFRLDLWTSSRLQGPYTPHPSSPISLDPRGARMAGPIVRLGESSYRFGQDGTERYGGRVRVHRVLDLSEASYREEVCGSIRFVDAWGPHTISMHGENLLVDFYDEVTNLGAGWRRLKSRLQ